VLLLPFLLNGCQSIPAHVKQKETQETMERNLREAAAISEAREELVIPPEVARALMPPIRFHIPEEKPVREQERRFDIAASEADVRQVYMNLVEGTPYSLVVHPDVQGKISLQLKNVTLLEALDSMRDVFGYEYRKTDRRIFILGTGFRTRMYPVNYLNFVRKGSSDVRVTASGLLDDGGNGIDIKTTSEANFWKELQDTLTTLIGAEGERKVVSNPQSGLVIVRALPAELRMVEEYLGLTHSTVNRQVILEAKILEVELNDGFQSGINWSGVVQSGNFSARGSQIGGGALPSEGGASNIAGNSADLATTDVNNSTASAFGGVFSLALRMNNFAAFAELLQTQGNVKVLSSPRVSTVNNQKAVIKVGGDEYFVTGVTQSQTNTDTNTQTAPTVDLKPFFSGIALDVTPQIDKRDNIILHIHPTVSEVSQRNKSFVIGDQTFSLPLAFSTVQESDNVVRAQSGQVIVIGGLMKEGSSDENATVPVLADIPVFGNLFKHKKVSRIKKELVILLKPTVVNINGPEWRDEIETSLGRVTSLE
jgi:MSHA biogenesis protein MshL